MLTPFIVKWYVYKSRFLCFHVLHKFDNLQLILNELFSWHLMILDATNTHETIKQFREIIKVFVQKYIHLNFRKNMMSFIKKWIIDFNDSQATMTHIFSN